MSGPELNHHRLAIAAGNTGLEVWDDENKAPLVTLYNDEASHFVELTPNEAKALAALLIVAADSQERRFAAQTTGRLHSQELRYMVNR